MTKHTKLPRILPHFSLYIDLTPNSKRIQHLMTFGQRKTVIKSLRIRKVTFSAKKVRFAIVKKKRPKVIKVVKLP